MRSLLTVFVSFLLLAACAGKPLVPYTTDTPPLVLLPASQANIADGRGRFREITCEVLEAHGKELPHYRPIQAMKMTPAFFPTLPMPWPTCWRHLSSGSWS